MNEELKDFFNSGKQNLIIIYILYIAGLVSPVLCLIGVAMAYVNMDNSVHNTGFDVKSSLNKNSSSRVITGSKRNITSDIENVKSIDYNSHYIFLYRTFWISLVMYVIATIGKLILIGVFIHMALNIWYIIRIVIGMNLLLKDKPHPDPKTLLFT